MSKATAVLLTGALVAALASALWFAEPFDETTQASPGVTMGVDANPSGNTATSDGGNCTRPQEGQKYQYLAG